MTRASQGKKRITKLRLALAGTAMGLLLAGCAYSPLLDGPPPPPRLRTAAGPGYAAAVRYLAAHPHPERKGRLPGIGMIAGILVKSSVDGGWGCLNGCTWHGTAIIAGGWLVPLSSSGGDTGMAGVASVGDLIEFPARGDVNTASENSGDNNITGSGRVLVAGAVSLP